MNRKHPPLRLPALVLIGLFAALPATAAGSRLVFLHHSTGRNLIQEGGARQLLVALSVEKNIDYALWDHDYNEIGLSDPAGTLLHYDFGVPADNTDPDGLYVLWTTDNAARDSLLSRFDVIAFKSCFPASAIISDAMLAEREQWYLEMRDVFDLHPDKIFLVMSQPPLHRLATNLAEADRARAFADWLGSDEYLAGHPNVHYFDFFDQLAHPDDGTATRNMLRYEFEVSDIEAGSHPNTLANQTVCPQFVAALTATAGGGEAAVDLPEALRLLGNHPNPFNPSTTIRFSLDRDAPVHLDVFDLGGRLVRTLVDASLAAGEHSVRWDGRGRDGRAAVSGVYLYRMRAGDTALSGRMVLAK